MLLFIGGNAFEVHRGMITQSAVESFWVIEGFDIIKEGQIGLVMVLESLVMDPFCFKRAPEGFHGGVVVAVAGGAHAGLKLTLLK